MATWHRLSTKSDYKRALARINELIDARRTEPVQNELMLLSFLVEEYEDNHHPMPDSPPHEVIRFMIAQKGLSQKDLMPILGSKGQVSKILKGSRNITLEKAAQLSGFLGIPLEALLPMQPQKEKFKKHASHHA